MSYFIERYLFEGDDGLLQKEEGSMKDYSMISQIEVTVSSDKANRLLDDWWILLDMFHNNEGSLFFVLGCERSLDLEMLYKAAWSKKVICDE